MGALPHDSPAPIAPPRAANAPVALAPSSRDHTLLRFIACGSVDDGKSTLIGRLMHDAGAVPDDQLESLAHDSRRFGTTGGDLDYALLVDGLSAEREQGITIDVTYRYFATSRRSFIVADAPGHEQYTRNMATGASTADLAIILIDACKGVLPQTRRHSFIVSLMGVRHVVVAVNKMDMANYDQAVFERIVRDYRDAVTTLGFVSIVAVPVAARRGENVATRSDRMAWHDGPTLLEHLESIEIAPAAGDAGFAMPVQWVNRPNPDFRGYAGMIARGVVQVGAEAIALPSGRRTTISRILTPQGEATAAVAGQSVTLTLADEIDVSRGDVLASPTLRPRIRRTATARILWMGEAPMRPGATYALRLGTATVNAVVETLHEALDVETFGAAEKLELGVNDIAVVTLSFDRALAIADFTESRDLGGFILVDRFSHETVAFGFIAPDGVDGRQVTLASPEVAALVTRAFGRPGTARRRDSMAEASWRLFSAAVVALLAWAATARVGLALAFGAADLVLRPVLRHLNLALWKKSAARRGAPDMHESGGGI